MPRNTDDLIREEEFTSVEDLRRKIPYAPPRLVASLENWLAVHRRTEQKARPVIRRRQPVKQRTAIRRTIIFSTVTRYGHKINVARDKRGRFVSSGLKKSKSRTYRIRKTKHAKPET